MRKFVFILTILIVMPVWATTVGSYFDSSQNQGLLEDTSITFPTAQESTKLESENNEDEKPEGFSQGQKENINQELLRVAAKWWTSLWNPEERYKQVTVFKSENNQDNQDNQKNVSQGLLRVAKKWWASLWTTEEDYKLMSYSCK